MSIKKTIELNENGQLSKTNNTSKYKRTYTISRVIKVAINYIKIFFFKNCVKKVISNNIKIY